MKRTLVFAVATVLGLALLVSFAGWALLAAWVPTDGKAWLIRAAEQSGAIHMTIGSVRYHWLRGFLADDVRITDRRSNTLVGVIPTAAVQVKWWPLALSRDVVFRGSATVERPAATQVRVAGRYRLRDHGLSLDAQTVALPLRSLTPPLAALIPSQLTDGTLRLTLHLRQAGGTAAAITGEVEGTELAWTMPGWRATGDAAADGTLIPPREGQRAWSYDARVRLRRAALAGVPTVGTITQLEGEVIVAPDRVAVRRLSGQVLGSRWNAEGTIMTGPTPSLEAHAASDADLAPLIAAWPTLAQEWQARGRADLEAVCRGPLGPAVLLDCLVQGRVHEAALTGRTLTDPLTGINGGVAYDVLARQWRLKDVTGQVRREPFRIEGKIELAPRLALALHVVGVVPLDLATPWLPPAAGAELGGTAAVDLHATGPWPDLQYIGDLDVRDAQMRLSSPALTVEHASGTVHGSVDDITLKGSATVNREPVALDAHLTTLGGARFTAVATLANGRAQLSGRLRPDAVFLDEGEVALAQSRVEVAGFVNRRADGPSALNLAGTVELADLARVPFLPLPAVEPWKLRGPMELSTQIRGTAVDWSHADVVTRLRSSAFSVRDVPVEQFLAVIERVPDQLRARVVSADVAGGTCTGEVTLNRAAPERSFRAQVDVTGLQLERLTQAVPAWQARAVTGTASAHMELAGPSAARAAWTGRGWLNASGERLGEVPLLDTLFRGLFGVLADRMGLEALRRAQLTQGSVQWQLAQGRFHTEELRLAGLAGTEPVAVYAKGSVGMDQTLDLVIEPELSEGTVLQAPTTASLAGTVLKAAGQLERIRRLIGRHHLTGTVSQPQYRFEFTTQEVLKQLAPRPADLIHQLFDAVQRGTQ